MTATSIAAGLVARTREVDPPADLVDSLSPDGFAWLTDGSGFVTSGVAARVPAGDVDRVLAGIENDDPVSRAGTGAIAVGSLPFRGSAQGELVIPASVTGFDSDGRAWRTEIGPRRSRRTRCRRQRASALKAGSPGPSGRRR